MRAPLSKLAAEILNDPVLAKELMKAILIGSRDPSKAFIMVNGRKIQLVKFNLDKDRI